MQISSTSKTVTGVLTDVSKFLMISVFIGSLTSIRPPSIETDEGQCQGFELSSVDVGDRVLKHKLIEIYSDNR